MSDASNVPFEERRRQQFLDEYTYEHSLPEWEESVSWGATGASSPQKPNDDGIYNARRFALGSSQQLTNLLYTGGELFERILQQVIATVELYETAQTLNPQARKLGMIDDYPVFEIYEPEDLFDLTKLASLTVLFNRPDLTRRVNACVEQKELFTDAVYGYIVTGQSVGDKTIDPQHQKRYQKLIDAIHAPSKEEALTAMHAYLKDWYKKHKGYLWHGTHEQYNTDDAGREVNDAYVGYWSFESAAVVYRLGLDDASLHEYMWYPKDIVAYARSQAAQAVIEQTIPQPEPPPSRYTGYSVAVGQVCQVTGLYEAPYLNNKVVLLTQGQKVAGDTHNQLGQITWYQLTELAAKEWREQNNKR